MSPTRLLFLAPGDVRKGRVEPISYMRTCAAFAARGLDVHLVTPWMHRVDAISKGQVFSHYGLEPTFRIHTLPTPLSGNAPTWWFRLCVGSAASMLALREAVRHAVRPVPLVLYTRSPVFVAPFLWFRPAFFRGPRPRLVMETHVLPNPANRWIVRSMDFIVVNSDRLRADVVERFDVPENRVLPVPLGPYNEVRPHPKREARERLGLPLHDAIACYSGKMIREQNEVLLLATHRVREAIPGFRLLLVGGNPAILEWTRRRMRELALEDAVVLAGFVAPREVELYQSAADVLVLTMGTALEHFPYATPAKAYEYMRIGRPVVASDFPLFAEVFGADGERAIRVGTDDASLASGIKAALSLPDGGQALAERGARFVEGRTWPARVDTVLEALGAVH